MIKRRHIESASAVLFSAVLIVLVHTKLSQVKKERIAADALLAQQHASNPQDDGNTATSNSNVLQTEDARAQHERRRAEGKSKRLTARTLAKHLPFSLSEAHLDLLAAGDTATVTHDLLQLSAQAVREERDDILGRTIAQLGSLSLLAKDIEAASVYLDEALEIFDLSDDELGTAGVELLRGQLNIERRWQAREAAYAQEDMQLAGWKIAHDRFNEAVPALRTAIETNIELDRFGAAAAAYEQLYKGYLKNDRHAEAIEAATEAARLHASSDRMVRARGLLSEIDKLGADAGVVELLGVELKTRQRDYESGIRQLGQARDYEQLYHHYLHEGDPVRAWQFRLKARESLKGVSRVAMHRRQTGIIALLYNSNDNMRNAKRSLNQAAELFTRHSADDLRDLSDSLRSEIY